METMGIRLPLLYQGFQAYRHGNLGDFALLKAEALGAKPNPAIAQQLQEVRGYYPPINLSQLIQLPPGTFGYEYASYMQRHQLQPFNISPELADIAEKNVFALRYAVTHDMFHLLLDFDTSYAGEIGVLAFAVEQKYSSGQALGLKIARILYPIMAPRQFKQIRANLNRGQLLGKKAKFLLNCRFEDYWEIPLSSLRKELGINLRQGKHV